MSITLNASTRYIHRYNYDHPYSADCFVNPDSYDFHQRVWNNREPNAYVIHNAGFIVAIVFPEYFAYTEQDALDEAADSGKLDFAKLDNYQEDGVLFLGNASEPFDSDSLDFFTVPVTLFRDDPLILDVIARSSREDALETIQSAKDAVLKRDADSDGVSPEDDLDAYYYLSDAEDYLIKTR